MCKHEMDLTKAVGATERTRDAGQMDGRTDRRSETNIPPQQFRCVGGIEIDILWSVIANNQWIQPS